MKSVSDAPPPDADELRDVLDAVPDLVATFDHDHRLLFLNASGRRMIAWNLLEMRSVPVLADILSEKDAGHINETALPAARERGSWTGTVSLKPASGEPRLVTLTILQHAPSPPKSRAFTVIARPVFASAREQALRLVHDLNNLIGPVLGYSELLASRLGADSPLKRFVDPIREAAERAREVLSRFSTEGPRRDNFEVVDLAELAEGAVSWTRAAFPRARIAVRAPEGLSLVYGDTARLQQVMLNLLRNAAESLESDGGTVDVSFASGEREGFVRFTVSDDGCGIDPEELPRIFDPHRSTKSEARGLGLSLAKEIVCSHGGRIRAESKPGEGSLFRVELPAYRPRKRS